MNQLIRLCALSLCTLALAGPAHAAFPVVFGATWDDPPVTLQDIVDGTYGPGLINVTTDYIGHDAGDLDPFYWSDLGFSALIIKEVAGHADNNVIGWYKETGVMPVIDGVDDGVVFTGPMSAGATAIISLGAGPVDFGFYMNPNGPLGAINAPEPELFFTHRGYNDLGPSGGGAIHEPFDGDVQALVFDLSAIKGPNTWLVDFEDLDYGATPGPCCSPTDNDFNDFVFEVTAAGATPVAGTSFGSLKIRYR